MIVTISVNVDDLPRVFDGEYPVENVMWRGDADFEVDVEVEFDEDTLAQMVKEQLGI